MVCQWLSLKPLFQLLPRLLDLETVFCLLWRAGFALHAGRTLAVIHGSAHAGRHRLRCHGRAVVILLNHIHYAAGDACRRQQSRDVESVEVVGPGDGDPGDGYGGHAQSSAHAAAGCVLGAA